jgi:hypothetical protein
MSGANKRSNAMIDALNSPPDSQKSFLGWERSGRDNQEPLPISPSARRHLLRGELHSFHDQIMLFLIQREANS